MFGSLLWSYFRATVCKCELGFDGYLEIYPFNNQGDDCLELRLQRSSLDPQDSGCAGDVFVPQTVW